VLPEGDLLSLSLIDSRPLLRLFTTYAPYIAESMLSKMQAEGVEFDVFAVPSAAALLPYFGSSVGTTTRTKTGILFQSRAAVPLPSIGMLVPLFLIGARQQPAVPLEGLDLMEEEETDEALDTTPEETLPPTPLDNLPGDRCASAGQLPDRLSFFDQVHRPAGPVGERDRLRLNA
jgi:hypothetical protein